MELVRGALANLVVGVSAVLVVVALALLPFLNPVWFAFEQDRAQAAALTGFDRAEVRTATDAMLSDLVFGPPNFDVQVRGQPVLSESDRAHMRDVRTVFLRFYLAAAIGAGILVAAFLLTRVRGRAGLWRRLSRSGQAIAVITVVGGLAALAFFDRAFLLFHEVFFPQGNYLFDPLTDRMVQLLPEQLWVETSTGVGIVVLVLAVALWWFGRRRASMIEARASRTPGTLSTVRVR